LTDVLFPKVNPSESKLCNLFEFVASALVAFVAIYFVAPLTASKTSWSVA
jgi:hypothetical protein